MKGAREKGGVRLGTVVLGMVDEGQVGESLPQTNRPLCVSMLEMEEREGSYCVLCSQRTLSGVSRYLHIVIAGSHGLPSRMTVFS